MAPRPRPPAVASNKCDKNFEGFDPAMSFDNRSENDLLSVKTSKRSFGIRAADSEGRRQSASMLISRMYAWRGYRSRFTVGDRPDEMALIAVDYHRGNAIATLSIRLDGQEGLPADELYGEQIGQLRNDGRRLCEMVKFAIEDGVNSIQLLGALFHVAFIYAHRLQGCHDLLAEVTPTHAMFYRRLLHFEQFGEEKLNPRVNTRGVLLRLNLEHAAQQIQQFGGTGGAAFFKSAYAYAFSEKEERGVIERLRAIDRSPEESEAAIGTTE